MNDMFTLAQIDQVTELASEGIKGISAIDDPSVRTLFAVLIILLVLAVWFSVKLMNLKFKDIDEKQDIIKKKDELIEKKTADLIQIGHDSLNHFNKFGQSVDKLTQTLMLIDERQKNDHDQMLDHIKTSTDYFKIEVDKMKHKLNTRTA